MPDVWIDGRINEYNVGLYTFLIMEEEDEEVSNHRGKWRNAIKRKLKRVVINLRVDNDSCNEKHFRNPSRKMKFFSKQNSLDSAITATEKSYDRYNESKRMTHSVDLNNSPSSDKLSTSSLESLPESICEYVYSSSEEVDHYADSESRPFSELCDQKVYHAPESFIVIHSILNATYATLDPSSGYHERQPIDIRENYVTQTGRLPFDENSLPTYDELGLRATNVKFQRRRSSLLLINRLLEHRRSGDNSTTAENNRKSRITFVQSWMPELITSQISRSREQIIPKRLERVYKPDELSRLIAYIAVFHDADEVAFVQREVQRGILSNSILLLVTDVEKKKQGLRYLGVNRAPLIKNPESENALRKLRIDRAVQKRITKVMSRMQKKTNPTWRDTLVVDSTLKILHPDIALERERLIEEFRMVLEANGVQSEINGIQLWFE